MGCRGRLFHGSRRLSLESLSRVIISALFPPVGGRSTFLSGPEHDFSPPVGRVVTHMIAFDLQEASRIADLEPLGCNVRIF